MQAQGINAILNARFKGRQFKVVSVTSGEDLSEAMTFVQASDEIDLLAYAAGSDANGAGFNSISGMELKEVK